MAMRVRDELFTLMLKLTIFILTVNVLIASSHGQDVPSPGMENDCVINLGYLACMGNGLPAPIPSRSYWAAIAISPSSLSAGGAHGRNSDSEAQETALQNCRSNGGKDCRVLTGGANQCVALALSHSDRSWGYASGINRVTAASNALAQCRKGGGKNCVLIVAPCGDDDVR